MVALVGSQDVDAPLVPFGLRPRRAQERVDNRERFGGGVHPAADADQLGVVVLPGQLRGLGAPRQRTARPGHLVGRDLLAIAGPTDHDPQALGVGHRAGRRRDAERRVVVLGVVAEGPAVDRLMAGLLQVLDDRFFEFVTGMVAAEVDAHGAILSEPRLHTCAGFRLSRAH